MSEQDIFQRAMRGLGVRPVDGIEHVERPAQTAPRDEGYDRALFLEAVERMSRGDSAPEEDRVSTPKRVNIPKKRLFQVDESLDLHGLTKADALAALNRFVISAFVSRRDHAIVVTGKGKSNPDRGPVLKPAVESWIRSKGTRYIRAYAEAPRAMGGAGAFVIYLRKA